MSNLASWMAAWSEPANLWYAKRLSGNDTLANGTHQAGPYIPREVLFHVLPDLDRPSVENPDAWFPLQIDSHDDSPRTVRAVWYNNALRDGTRNEARVTNFGGNASALLDPDSTGALTVFVFVGGASSQTAECRVWVCRSEFEEDLLEERLGPVEPGRWLTWSQMGGVPKAGPKLAGSCELAEDEVPRAWLSAFPSGAELVAKAIEMRPESHRGPDERLLRRRDCEFEVFLSVEQAVEMPNIRAGFSSVGDFVDRAQTILQRRKARAGRSLELHTKQVFIEEGLREGRDFDYEAVSDPGRRPDFLFPSQASYQDPTFPSERLRMLAVKTTCRDRWRQVLNEADRISTKHLFTLQEGVSEGQIQEMSDSGVQLVVPSRLLTSYPKTLRSELVALDDFIDEVKRA